METAPESSEGKFKLDINLNVVVQVLIGVILIGVARTGWDLSHKVTVLGVTIERVVPLVDTMSKDVLAISTGVHDMSSHYNGIRSTQMELVSTVSKLEQRVSVLETQNSDLRDQFNLLKQQEIR